MNYYEYVNKGSKTRNGCLCDIFTFKSEDNLSYVVEVEHHEYNVIIVKFYLKSHQYSADKYNFTLKKIQKDKNKHADKQNEKTGSGRFIRILTTLLKISLDYYKKDDTTSFAFIGAPRLNEKESHLNDDHITWSNTIRYRIYKTFALNNYSPKTFNHITIEESSFYLLKNRKNKKLTKTKALEIFKSYVID